MRIRLKSRQLSARSSNVGDDNIFSEIQDVEKPRAIVPRRVPSQTAEVLRPAAFRAQSVDTIRSDTPARLRGVSALWAKGRVVTPQGPKTIGQLAKGDLVLTRDNGFRPVLMTLPVIRGAAAPCVIEVSQGALGGGKPDAALRMSGRQRVLMSGPSVQSRFGVNEVLARAGDLLHLDGVRQVSDETEMVALLFGSHEVLRVNESWLDSVQPDRETRAHLSAAQEADLLDAVPMLKDLPIERSYPAARKVLNSAFARQITLP